MNYPTIRKIPEYTTQTKKPVVKIFQWPNGSFSLFTRKPTKHPSISSQGILIGMYYTLEKAREAARLWMFKHKNKYNKGRE